MKLCRSLFLSIILLGFSFQSFAQEKSVTYELKKGEVFDILLLTTKTDSKVTFKEYREKAFPVAVEMGYSFLPGFKIAETTQGNYQPEGIVFGKWESLAKREKFLTEIDARVPDFHAMRKKIWSLFDVTYYEVQKDISFELNLNKVIVATAYWKHDDEQSDFDNFITQWKKDLEKTGGALKAELTNGYSPFGYYYKPDYLVISQWESREGFEKFLKQNLERNTKGLKNVSQYILSK